MLKSVFLGIFLLLLFPSVVHAQVVINEISANDEWIELYNITSSEVNLNGYELSMGSDSQKIIFTSSDTISANSFKVLEKNVTPSWTDDWINNSSGDTIQLKKSDGSIETITFSNSVVCIPGSGKTIGRYPDANNTIERLGTPTKGTSNVFDVSTSCNPPTPTLTSTPTPTPTNTPTPTPTATPRPSSTPVATKTPTPRPTSTSLANSEEEKATDPNAVLGLREELKTPTPTPSTQEGTKSIPIVAIGFIVLGVGFMGFGGYTFLQQMRSGYTE